MASTPRLLAERRIHQPSRHFGWRISFADGTESAVFRETVLDLAPSTPCVLVVMFRLRWIHGTGHWFFRRESLLNTPLFAGFPGLVSKLWLAHDRHDRYRGLYEWDGPQRAERYARSLWRVLSLVSVSGSIGYRVLPNMRRDRLLDDPACLNDTERAWWRPIAVRKPDR
jgi:hypothetical protein